MLKEKDNQLSIYSILYNRIPENHMLKILYDEVDFSFINRVLEKTYSKYYGRPAKEPELMVKLLVLQRLYKLSDERVVEDASLNLAYNFHGLDHALGYSLKSMTLQAKLTVLAVNLKRIAAILSSKKQAKFNHIVKILKQVKRNNKFRYLCAKKYDNLNRKKFTFSVPSETECCPLSLPKHRFTQLHV